MPPPDKAPTPILFLAGRGDLDGGTRALKLEPKQPEPEYTSLTLVVDASTFQMRQLIVVDTQGGSSTFTFRNLRENTGVADSRFVFKIPRGVDVINQG
jgi:outer membrane lipoprotein-sorting protein